MNLSEPQRRLAVARQNVLESQLQLARQTAIARQLRREGYEMQVAERVLRALRLRHQTAEGALRSPPEDLG